MNKISFEEYQTKIGELNEKLVALAGVYREANALVENLDWANFTDKQKEDARDIAYDIAYDQGWEIGSNLTDGFWKPSSC